MMPCSVFVNGRSRASIMDDMKTRIDARDWMAEVHAAIKVGPPPLLRNQQLILSVQGNV